jgi:uncharacterized protein YutE (UPF0331/DUF86 family)
MLRPEVIRKRLAKVEEYLTILRGLQRYTRDEFLAEPEKYGSTERFLQLTLEALTDLGSHVIAEQDLGVVDAASDIPRLLREHGDLTDSQRDTWIRMIGFRNILVHDYLDVDRQVVYEVLHAHLQDITDIAAIFRRFL